MALIDPSPTPDDSGIALDSLDHTPASFADALNGARYSSELRRLGRKLRAEFRHDPAHQPVTSVATTIPVLNAAPTEPPLEHPPLAPPAVRGGQESKLSFSIELLLSVGLITLLTGVGCLAWSAADGPPIAFQWGMPAAVAGQSLLLLGLARLVARVWRTNGKLTRQLDGVDRQLYELRRSSTPRRLSTGP